MLINRDPSQFHYMTDKGIVLNNKSNKGVNNSLGRTARALLVYEDAELIDGVKSFFNKIKTTDGRGYHYYVVRYPESDKWDYARGNSRDHVIKAIAALKHRGDHDFVKDFIKHKAKRPCIDHTYTIDQRIWFLALYSNFWSWGYLIVKSITIMLTIILNAILHTITWTWMTYKDPKEFVKHYPEKTALKYQGRWRRFIFKLIHPTFATYYGIFAINAIQSISAKCLLRKIQRISVEKNNHVCRMMLNDYRYVKPYVTSRANRWSIRLDDLCNRYMTIYPNDTPKNNLELGELYRLKNKFGYKRKTNELCLIK